jgi:hypothetical protein
MRLKALRTETQESKRADPRRILPYVLVLTNC